MVRVRAKKNSGSSSAITFGVKLLLSVTNKKKRVFFCFFCNSLDPDQMRRLLSQISFYHGSENWEQSDLVYLFCNICYFIALISKRESRQQSGIPDISAPDKLGP